jgi:glycosyltransferase involved in cell wall biosynthesis
MVHPSQEEAFGHVLIEAMGMGTPVIAAAEAQAPTWILGQGRNGVVVPCHSPGPLAEACIALLSDKARWEAVGLAGWTAARREFTVARMTEAYLALYRQILGA